MSGNGKRLYISLGFDVTNLLGSLLDRGFVAGDSVVLVVPKNRSQRNEEAIKKVEALLAELGTRGYKVDLEVLELDEHNPDYALEKLISHVKRWDGEIYLDAVGGLRVFCVLMTLTSVLVSRKNLFLTSIAENSGKRVSIPRLNLKIARSLSGAKFELMKAMVKKERSIEELENDLRKDKSTLSRQLANLESLGLLERISSKPAKYRITNLGKLVMLSLPE